MDFRCRTAQPAAWHKGYPTRFSFASARERQDAGCTILPLASLKFLHNRFLILPFEGIFT